MPDYHYTNNTNEMHEGSTIHGNVNIGCQIGFDENTQAEFERMAQELAQLREQVATLCKVVTAYMSNTKPQP